MIVGAASGASILHCAAMGGTLTGGAWLAALLGWLAGVALQLQQGALWPPAGYALAAALAWPALAAAWRWRRAAAARASGIAIAALLLAFAGTGWRAAERLADALAPALEGSDLVLTGIVAGLPQPISRGQRFRFEVESAMHRGEPVHVPRTVLLAWYDGFGEDAAPNDARAGLRAGQRWRFTARLRRPHGLANPHGFDAELWLFEQGLRASGYVRDEAPQRLAEAAGHPVDRWRQRVRDAIAARVPDGRAAGVLAALAVGDQAAIDGFGQ